MRKGLVDLQGPHAFVVHSVRGDTPLLAQRPEADGPIRAAGQTLPGEQSGIKELRIPAAQHDEVFEALW